MTTTRLPFAPAAVMAAGADPVTRRRFLARTSTTEEQREEAVGHALAWMASNRVWIVEVEVTWTRGPATILTVRGHAEHIGSERIIVPCLDSVTEVDLDGRAIHHSLAEDQMTLERELVIIYANPLE